MLSEYIVTKEAKYCYVCLCVSETGKFCQAALSVSRKCQLFVCVLFSSSKSWLVQALHKIKEIRKYVLGLVLD